MIINRYSGRTFNELGQYPVMPWVITNYDADPCEVDFDFIANKGNLRDLKVPAGKIDAKKFEKLKLRCN